MCHQPFDRNIGEQDATKSVHKCTRFCIFRDNFFFNYGICRMTSGNEKNSHTTANELNKYT